MFNGVPPIFGNLLDETDGLDTEEGLNKLANHVPLQAVDRILTAMMINVTNHMCGSDNQYESLLLYKARLENLYDLKKSCAELLLSKQLQEENIKNGLAREHYQ